jgi:thiol:disulfide interchange protein DsbC
MSSLLATAALVALLPASATAGMSTEEALAAKLPGVEAEQIKATPIPGIWEVSVGRQVVYVSEDGRYLLRGEIFDLMENRSLTDDRLAELDEGMSARFVSALANDFDESRMIVFAPENPKHTVTVFTDVDCGYCRKLHGEIDEYNKLGIAVRYVFMPLAGPGSTSWAKADAVWCSSDRKDAMTRAKQGEDIKPTGACEDTPVAEHYRLGRELGIQGTPGMVTDAGQFIPGYMPPDRLAAALEAR